MRRGFPDATIAHAAGVAIESGDESGIAAAVALARTADLVVLCVGESAVLSGEATSRTSLDLPGRQRTLSEAVLAVDRPTVAIVFCGRPKIIPGVDALIAALHPGNEAGDALADILGVSLRRAGGWR